MNARLKRQLQHLPSINRIPATTPAKLTIWGNGVFAVAGGLAVWTGGYERWSLVTFSTLNQVPGGPYVLGPILVAAGLLTLTGSIWPNWWVKAVGLVITSVWCCMIAGGVAASASINPVVSTLGPVAFLYMAFGTAVLIVIDESKTP